MDNPILSQYVFLMKDGKDLALLIVGQGLDVNQKSSYNALITSLVNVFLIFSKVASASSF